MCLSDMRSCKQCGIEKSEDDFYASRPLVCKGCVKVNVHLYRNDNIDRVRAADRNRGYHGRLGYPLEYRERYPKRRSAQIALNNALRDGRVTPWPVCALPTCDRHDPEAHHPDYDSPLAVVWLCPPHHKQAHALIRKAA